MTPPPRRALVFHVRGIEFVVRPAAFLLFGSIAAALDVTFLPLALPGRSPLAYHLTAAIMALLMIVTTLLHESGHAIAYRLQGIWPVRITLRGSGGACAAMVDADSPGRALARALAGPAATALVVAVLVTVWHLPLLPPTGRLIAATLAVFSLFDLLFNTLPVHPRCDGTHALRALLWLARRCEPEPFAVLYLWRPTILAAAVLGLCQLAAATGFQPFGAMTLTIGALCALALCAVPPLVLARRLVAARLDVGATFRRGARL